MTDETEVEKSFCLSRSEGWVINRKMMREKSLCTIFYIGFQKPGICVPLDSRNQESA
jgi:hypothetical protein